jgi:SAM-dependent methyltransferase
MYGYNLHSLRGSSEAAAVLYFCKGHQIAEAALAVLRGRFGGERAPGGFLDFAAGFGRATRFLARRLPPETLFASDLAPEAAAFHREALGVAPLPSARDPRDFEAGRRFSAILAASLFSHLPPRAFDAWLARLFALLEPGGVLLMSTHGPELLDDPAADWSGGCVFRPESETRRLAPEDYGTSWVTEEFVRASAARAGAGAVRAFPRGLCAHQDLYAILRGGGDGSELAVPRFPRGALDAFAIGERTVAVAGWAADEGAVEAPAVRLFLDGGLAGELAPVECSPRRRWSFDFPRAIPPDAVVRVEARTRGGLSNVLAMGTLRPHLEKRV